jgi:hypothetical protein
MAFPFQRHESVRRINGYLESIRRMMKRGSKRMTSMISAACRHKTTGTTIDGLEHNTRNAVGSPANGGGFRPAPSRSSQTGLT